MGLTSVDIALWSAVLSLVSAYVAVRMAWATKFSPPNLVGTLPYVILWTFFEKKDGKPNDHFLVPAFWLSNIGARPMLVDDLRLVLGASNSKPIVLYPTHTVPTEAIESPNLFNEHELLRSGKAPFSGFSIAGSQTWSCCYAFHISNQDHTSLTGMVVVSVEVRGVGSSRYKSVLSDTFTFGKSSFNWLEWVGVGGPQADYYYSGAMRNRPTHERA